MYALIAKVIRISLALVWTSQTLSFDGFLLQLQGV